MRWFWFEGEAVMEMIWAVVGLFKDMSVWWCVGLGGGFDLFRFDLGGLILFRYDLGGWVDLLGGLICWVMVMILFCFFVF